MDARQRIGRARAVRGWVKVGMRGSKLTRNSNARIVEAMVSSSLLYDCQSRV